MPQSFVHNFAHVVFSTKHRLPLITSDIETSLHKYLTATCLNLNCHPKRIGGYNDHVHILCDINKNMLVTDFVKEIKQSSSKWMKATYSRRTFYWQAGYASFSVGYSDIGSVVNYIDQQHDHHRKETFQDEVRRFLFIHSIPFDERYMWD